jgi:hypothetical protein
MQSLTVVSKSKTAASPTNRTTLRVDYYGCAAFAVFQVFVHSSAQADTDLALQVIRDLAPHLVATDFHCLGPACLHLLGFVLHPFCARFHSIAV